MKKFILFFMILASVLGGCRETPKTIQKGSGDAAYQKLSEEFLSGYLDWRPQYAVYLGLHEYDGKLPDFGKASIEKELVRLKAYHEKLGKLDTAALSPAMYYDFQILQGGINNEIFNFEEVDPFTNNPMTYAGALDVSNYIKRNFAPLDDRLKSVIAIEKKVADMFRNAKLNLKDSLARPFITTAIQIAEGNAAFLKGDVNSAFGRVKNDSLWRAFKIENEKAIFELNSFASYLKTEKLPRATVHYALGREKYQQMLFDEEGITLPVEKILEMGLNELAREKEVFNQAARVINPNKKASDVFNDVAADHPTSGSLISDVTNNMESIRQFIVDHHIVTIPSEIRVQVKETPEFARASSTASMDPPGPFEKKAREAYYYVTPVDPAWTRQQQADWLSGFNRYTADLTTIHEVYPGHYVQFLHAMVSSCTRVQKIFGSYAFVEGWAHYGEKMMIDEGFENTGDPIVAAKYRLAQSNEALLRLCRLCVSIKMHCNGMTVEDAVKFFMKNQFEDEKRAEQEALRGTFDPEYLYYTLGKLEILKLREDYKKQEGANFSLQKFHDQVLDHGLPSIRLLRELLLKDRNSWNEVL
jgi:uncharacterized protein (DUF885 family)